MDTETIKQTIKFNASLEVMTFDEASFLSNTVFGKLSQQRKDGKFCDAVLTINEKDFSAHKCVLAANSAYFENALSESHDGSVKQRIKVYSNSTEHLIQVLDYIYTGQIAIDTNNFAEVVDLAVRFSLTKLQDHCTKYLIKNINDKTCFHIHDLAKQHGLSSLMKIVDGFVFANILKLIDSDSILEVGLSSLEMLIGRSVPLLELQRLTVITKWIEHKRTMRKNSLPILLKIVHWSELPANELSDFIENSPIVLEDDWMHFHVLLSLNNADLLPENCKEKFSSLREMFAKPIVTSVAAETDDQTNAEPENPRDDDLSDGGTVSYPTQNEIPVPSRKRESIRLAMKLKKVQDSQLGTSSNLKQGGKSERPKSSRVKEANKENLTDGLNTTSGKVTKNKEAKKKKSDRIFSVKVRKPRGGQQKYEKATCSECSFKTNSHIKLERHFKVAHKDLTKTFSCDICEFSCKWNRQFYDHLRDDHFPGPPFHCDKCGHSALSIQRLLLHRMDHLELRPHCCSICGARFKVRYVLDAHLRSHTGERPFKCVVCHRSFATKGTLDQHKNTHNTQHPYLCQVCGFSTKYQSHLKTHSRLHTGEVFKCQFENCDYKTPKRSRLACHQRSHLHVRCHTCSTCGKGFVEKSHLVRHEKIHLDFRPYRCELCDYSSTRRDKLNEHGRKHHDASSADNNKMAYRPRKSRLLSAIAKDPDFSPVPSSSKSSPSMRKVPIVSKQLTKRKFGPSTLDSIPEDDFPESSTTFAKRAKNISKSVKIRCNTDLIAREAEMRMWLEKSSKETPISPIKIDTGVAQQTSMSDISPNLHSFSSHYSSSSGISKGNSGSSSSGIGSQGTGKGNLMISPSTSNANAASDLSSPGAGSSSSQHLSPSMSSGKTLEANGDHPKHDGNMTFTKIQKLSATPKILTICTQQISPELQAARKKLIQERLKRFVTSKSPSSANKKIITISHPPPLPPAHPISVVTFKPDDPSQKTDGNLPKTSCSN